MLTQKQQFLLSDYEVQIQEEEIEQRHKEILHIQNEMQEVHSIMKDLQQITAEQGDQVRTIEQMIQNSVKATNEGVKELEKAEEIQPVIVNPPSFFAKIFGRFVI